MTAYDGICRDMSGYQVGRIPDGQGWPSRAESRSSASRLGDSAKMSASRLGDSGDSALTRAVTQPAVRRRVPFCRYSTRSRRIGEDGLAARCSCALHVTGFIAL